MSFSESAGTTIVPTLARLVLAGVFITAGYQKVFTEVTYTAEEAQTLRDIGFSLNAPSGTAMDLRGGQVEVLQASFRQDDTSGDQDTGGGDDTGQDPPPDTGDQDTGDPDTGDQDTGDDAGDQDPAGDDVVSQEQPEELMPQDVTPTPGEAVGKGALRVALMVDAHGWPQPRIMTWVAAYTELVGGILILIGLFSRLWGLGLAIVMGVAFYFTSLDGLRDAGFNPYTIMSDNMQLFQTMFLQLSLCVLGLTVLFAGPGPISIDRLLFGKSASEGAEEL